MTNKQTSPGEEPMEQMEMVKMCGPVEAEMIQEILANNGIECTLQGDLSANTIPATGEMDEVRIWVREEQAERATELVEAFFTPLGDEEREEGESDLGVDGPDEPFKA